MTTPLRESTPLISSSTDPWSLAPSAWTFEKSAPVRLQSKNPTGHGFAGAEVRSREFHAFEGHSFKVTHPKIGIVEAAVREEHISQRGSSDLES